MLVFILIFENVLYKVLYDYSFTCGIPVGVLHDTSSLGLGVSLDIIREKRVDPLEEHAESE